MYLPFNCNETSKKPSPGSSWRWLSNNDRDIWRYKPLTMDRFSHQPEWTPPKAGKKAHLIIYLVCVLNMGCACLLIPFHGMNWTNLHKDSRWNWDYFHLIWSELLHCVPQNVMLCYQEGANLWSPRTLNKWPITQVALVPILSEISILKRPSWIRCGNESRLKMATSISVLFKYARKSKGGNRLYLQVASPEWSKLDFNIKHE